nr:MAG TPA: hypothetical protein [Caudoviricetes sp.]
MCSIGESPRITASGSEKALLNASPCKIPNCL